MDTSPHHYQFKQPGTLLHLLAGGSSVLFTNDLTKPPYRALFQQASEQKVCFFVCSALKRSDGLIMGAFGVIGERKKSLLLDEKAFIAWLADNLADEIQLGSLPEAIEPLEEYQFPEAIIPFLDDIYMMSDPEGVIISMAEQVPASVRDTIAKQGGTLDTVFGKNNTSFFHELITLTEATHNKQTNILQLACRSKELLYSVSCNRFSAGWYLFTFSDITERNRLRELLESRKQLLEGMVQAANVGILLLNEAGQVLYCNHQAALWLSIEAASTTVSLPAEHWPDDPTLSKELSPFRWLFTQQQTLKDHRYHFEAANAELKVLSITATLASQQLDGVSQATFFIKDVTERAQIEQAMIDMDAQMQFLLQSSPVVIYQRMFLPKPVLSYISPNANAILGFPADKLSDGTIEWQSLVHPEDWAGLESEFSSPKQTLLEYRLKVADKNEYRWFKDVRHFIEGDIPGCIGALLDITDRKLQEQQLEQAQMRFEQLTKHLPGMLYQFQRNPDGSSCFPFSTLGIQQIYGVTPEQVRLDASLAFAVLHPDDIERVVQSIEHSASTLETWQCRYRVLLGTQQLWVQGLATPTRLENGAVLWHGYIHDVSEQQAVMLQAQKFQGELSATLNSLNDAVVTIDAQGTVVSVNPATTKMFGYSPEELLGNNISMLMPEQTARLHDGYLASFAKTGQASIIGIGREVEARHKDGHLIPIALSISEIDYGDEKHFVGCCHDLTQFKQQQTQLMHSEKLSAVGQLTSSLAHDFNNILGIIRGYAEMLQQEADAVAELARPIVDASDRASAIIAQLLDFSSTKQRSLSHLRLDQHLEKLAPLMQKALNKDVTLTLALNASGACINVEQPAFDNSLINLAVNANHAMAGSEDAVLSITTACFNSPVLAKELGRKEDAFISISFKDNGCGMPKDVLKKIFEPFFTTKGHAGTGLGLAQTYGMVQRCHGRIDVASEPDVGTCFTLYFPCEHHSVSDAVIVEKVSIKDNEHLAGEDAAALGNSKASSVSHEPAADYCILLVDDEPELLEMHAMLLESSGFKVLQASSAEAALKLAEQHPCDLLLSDIMMPGMNGFELAQTLKANYPDIKVQLMSGFTSESSITNEQSKTWYEQRLKKPVSFSVLLSRISEVLTA
ncbi:PAS domain S-box protein [Alkalimonas delamerensis]|uniref:histidine kinase n=1 Tax=Alkalimonas delamerensis TaxID=265981 RepID=A0ABT9GNH1_9GAMM|nr:PAS domain-containing sensor histidine kinase [Alkalimonas delamerensis]MDP4528511.1 PAS domain S-box protein [Alkalimonas delamerensis]